MQTITRQKQRTRSAGHNLNNNKSNENEKKNGESENEPKKNKSKELKNSTKDIRKLLTYSIDPYDTPLMWWETKHVRYAINYPPVKSRLKKLMGSHVVRLTDYKYMEKLASAISNDYVEQQKIRIERRKLAPPSIINRLLDVSYKALSEKIQKNKHNKIKLYV